MSNLDVAKQKVLAFRGTDARRLLEPSPRGWPVTRGELARQLSDRLVPNLLANYPDQGWTSRCGPAAFLYCLLHDRPDLYVQFALDLWQTGQADIGGASGSSFPVRPGPGTIASAADAGAYHITALDWITMGSLSSPRGNASPGEEVGAITLPEELRSWFRAAGSRIDVSAFDSVNGTTWIGDVDVLDFQRGMALFPTHWIVLEIQPQLLSSDFGRFQRHWVVVNEQVMPTFGTGTLQAFGGITRRADLKQMPLSMQFACWGVRNRTLRPGITVGEFLDRWYGIGAFTHIP